MNLADQFRPASFDGVAGQDKAIANVQRVLKRGWGGRAWWITGASGTGKTTIARIIAQDGASPWAIWEIDAQDCTMDFVRDMVDDGFAMRSLGAGGKCWIINEAQGMRAPIAERFLTALEAMPDHCCVIFTTSRPMNVDLFGVDHDAGPLYSRCVVVKLQDTAQSRLALARRAKAVAMQAGCDGLPEEMYVHALNACNGNLRALLQRVESGQMTDTAREYAEAYLGKPLKEQEAGMRATMQAVLTTI